MPSWTKEQMREWVERWKVAGPMLAKVRDGEVQNTNTQEALSRLSGMFELARLHFRPTQTSGLVEQQALFSKGRKLER